MDPFNEFFIQKRFHALKVGVDGVDGDRSGADSGSADMGPVPAAHAGESLRGEAATEHDWDSQWDPLLDPIC